MLVQFRHPKPNTVTLKSFMEVVEMLGNTIAHYPIYTVMLDLGRRVVHYIDLPCNGGYLPR